MRDTSPVAGSNPLICTRANDCEFSVATYVGVCSYVNENADAANSVYT